MEKLLKKAEELAGRPIEVTKTSDGKHIVLWMRFGASPPPKEDTPEQALRSFIDMLLKLNDSTDNMSSDGHKFKGEGNDSGTGHTAGTS